LFTVGKVILCIRERDVGKGKDRTQNIGLSQAIEEVWEGKGSMGGSVLQEKGRLRKRVICKATIRAPGNNVHARRQGNTIGIRTELSNSSGIIISHKGHFNRETTVITG
jgi:hypothetical protein